MQGLLRKIKSKVLLPLVIVMAAGGYAYKAAPIDGKTGLEAAQAYSSTEDYLRRFDPNRYMRAGTDFFNPRYSPARLNKPLDQIDITYDYPFEYLEKVEAKLSNIDRRIALQGIFRKITSESKNNLERHLAVLDFLYKAAYHNAYVQPMYEDKQAVYDPIVLLKLGEMRCGGVARVAADLFEAAGYKTRLVQAQAHITTEIFYDGGWHLFEADLVGGPPVLINGHIPSVAELADNPFLIDRSPSHFAGLVSPGSGMGGDESPVYPSYYFFSKQALEGLDAAYYYKTATPEEAAQSKWYGWNYYKTTTNRWKLSDFGPKYEPAPPNFKNVSVKGGKFVVEWLPALDSDNDLLGYRIFVATKSRGWNYQDINASASVKKYFVGGWKPEMYDHLFKTPPRNIAFFETKSTRVELPVPETGEPIYVTVMPFDQHGETVGRWSCPCNSGHADTVRLMTPHYA